MNIINNNGVLKLMVGILPFFFFTFLPLSAQQSADSPLRKLNIAELAINALYVDSVDENKLVEDAIRGMLEKLDPHSSYSTPKEVKEMNEPLQGNFEGIGVQFNMVEDTLVVIQPVSNGPSEKVGIVAGDRIVTVNDTAIAGVKMAKEEIMKRLRGPKGTKVVLGIVRRGIKDKLVFTVIRDKIPVKSIDASYMATPTVGYIRIGNFGAQTYDEFCACVTELKKQGMQDLILDLQENGGGYLQAAVQIADEFLRRGDLIVYTTGRQVERREYRAQGHGMLMDGKVVVLVDSYTASAAEIVSGAIQDHDRGIIVGRRTFGKGLVQRPIDLPDGSMIRLTIAHYYTPSGRCIQKPYEKGKQKDYAEDMLHRLKSGELMSADSVHFADSLKYYTLKKHRVVYGGGGIMPDEFVPLDTTKYTRYHRELSAKSIILNANLKYVDQHRKQLRRQYKTFADFRQRFEVPQEVIDGIFSKGEKENIRPKDDAERDHTLPYLRLQLKALIARDLWDMSEYFAIMNEYNDAMQRALQLLNAQTVQEDLDEKYATELVKPGTVAPDFTMKTPDGKTIQLSKFAKGKTVVLDFWASWCPDCRKDAPEVVRMYDTYHKSGIEFIGISMDTNVEAWKAAIEKYGIKYPQVSELKKFKETDIHKAYGVNWIPSIVIVGPDGRVKLSTVMIDKADKYLKELTSK